MQRGDRRQSSLASTLAIASRISLSSDLNTRHPAEVKAAAYASWSGRRTATPCAGQANSASAITALPVSGELEPDLRRGRPALGQRRQQGVRLGGRQPDGFVPVLAEGRARFDFRLVLRADVLAVVARGAEPPRLDLRYAKVDPVDAHAPAPGVELVLGRELAERGGGGADVLVDLVLVAVRVPAHASAAARAGTVGPVRVAAPARVRPGARICRRIRVSTRPRASAPAPRVPLRLAPPDRISPGRTMFN